ncbi:MAG: MFS transporter, partial [Nonomuraea sp.]|nr:MFS transporter [Nonomuraea sp.]
AALAGTVAQLTSPGAAMTTLAATSLAVTLTLAAAGRRQVRDAGPVAAARE